MSQNTRNDIKTLAYVLRRTNYAEADRILNLITPEGKMSAIAKGARKEKSKLASGIEMFSLVELNIHFGRTELGVVTSSKMVKFYSDILASLERVELATMILKRISLAAEVAESPEYFKITDVCLKAINRGADLELVEAWFWLNYTRAMGEQINLYFDTNGKKLSAGKKYDWNAEKAALEERTAGVINANTIKLMRLMLAVNIDMMEKVSGTKRYFPAILRIARAVNKI